MYGCGLLPDSTQLNETNARCDSHHMRRFSTICKHGMDIYVCRRILTIYVACRMCVCLRSAVRVNRERVLRFVYIKFMQCKVKTNEIEICAFFLAKALFTWYLTHERALSSASYMPHAHTHTHEYVCIGDVERIFYGHYHAYHFHVKTTYTRTHT